MLKLIRKRFSDRSTIGELFFDGQRHCFTLEDAVRPVKIAGRTAIPAGTYEVVVTLSSRFKRRLPLLLNVPDFEGIRIHCGNRPEDTEGCILVGTTEGPAGDFIGQSRGAFEQLLPVVETALQHGKLFIEIVEERGA